jgi:membrane-bound serine protease (ClpP class)
MELKAWAKQIFLILLVFCLYLWSWNQAFGADVPSSSYLELNGYLGSEELHSAFDTVVKTAPRLLISINSNSGDLIQLLDLAKKIYAQKIEKQLHVIVYIEDNAVGPSAIIPFLADELYTSSFISWGDIPLGNEKLFAANILRNRVGSLIDPSNKKAAVLELLAAAMCDPSVYLIEDKNGWRVAQEAEQFSGLSISSKGETLVVNQNQLKELGLVKDLLSGERFRSLFAVPSPTSSQSIENSTLEGQPLSHTALEQELIQHILYHSEGPNRIGHILIDDRTSGINQSTWLYVKSALDTYKESRPIFIILELNTPGGEVFSAQKISDALKEFDTQYNIPVIAYVNNWAISAGAMLALSCRFIAVAKDGSIGAAEPIIQDQTGKMETASEKINSALRTDFANRARFFGRNPFIAEAMVDKDTILVVRHGKVIKLDNESQIKTSGQEPDLILSRKGKLLTLDSQQALEYGVADFLVPPTKTVPFTTTEEQTGKWAAEKMSLMHLPFFKEIPNATIDAYRMDWKMRFFAFLASPAISSLLFLGLVVGFYLEMSTPGFGLAGTVAVTSLFLIILSSFSLEIGNWLELILLFTGIAIILVELFILPTFGLLGFIGVLFFLIGLFGMMLPGLSSVNFEFDTKTFNAAGDLVLERLAWLSGSLILALLLIILLARYVTPSFAGFNRFVLKGNEQTGYIAGENPTHLPQPGEKGVAVTVLRPAGKIVIGEVLYDAMSAGGFIEKDTKIQVLNLEGSTIVVGVFQEVEKKT